MMNIKRVLRSINHINHIKAKRKVKTIIKILTYINNKSKSIKNNLIGKNQSQTEKKAKE